MTLSIVTHAPSSSLSLSAFPTEVLDECVRVCVNEKAGKCGSVSGMV